MVTGVQATMPTGAVTVGAAAPAAQHVPQEAVQPPTAQTTTTVTVNQTTTQQAAASPTPAAPRKSSENRRSNKPIMEKRRRARINNCLNDLKALILDAMKKDPARHSKLEKADILEMTVKHLESVNRQQVILASASDPAVINKFRAGFAECASEVGRFPGLEASAKRRLMSHLASCLGPAESNASNGGSSPSSVQSAQTTTTQLQVHILPQVDATSTIQVQQSNGIVYMNANGTALQLVPTRLPNGNIALVAAGAKSTATTATVVSPVSTPASSPAPSSPLPTLIPIPQRTASTASASSSSSSSSSTSTSAASPVAFEAPPSNFREQSQSPPVAFRDQATSPASTGYTSDPEFDPRVYSEPLQKPLSLVMRKSVIKEAIEEKCWRPW